MKGVDSALAALGFNICDFPLQLINRKKEREREERREGGKKGESREGGMEAEAEKAQRKEAGERNLRGGRGSSLGLRVLVTASRDGKP